MPTRCRPSVPSDALQWDLVDVSIHGVAFRDPVLVEMITGKVYALDRSNWAAKENSVQFTNLRVWDSPVMLAERSQVPLQP